MAKRKRVKQTNVKNTPKFAQQLKELQEELDDNKSSIVRRAVNMLHYEIANEK